MFGLFSFFSHRNAPSIKRFTNKTQRFIIFSFNLKPFISVLVPSWLVRPFSYFGVFSKNTIAIASKKPHFDKNVSRETAGH